MILMTITLLFDYSVILAISITFKLDLCVDFGLACHKCHCDRFRNLSFGRGCSVLAP